MAQRGIVPGWSVGPAVALRDRAQRPEEAAPTSGRRARAYRIPRRAGGQPASAAARFEAAEELRWALARLPEAERDVVVLRDLVGMDGQETADALGLSLAAMKSRLHRGRLRLMSVLRGTEGDDG